MTLQLVNINFVITSQSARDYDFLQAKIPRKFMVNIQLRAEVRRKTLQLSRECVRKKVNKIRTQRRRYL